MNREEPKFRCGTGKAMEKIAADLNLRIESGMQDWSYEVADEKDFEKYLIHYDKLNNDDEKFVLMEILIQSATEQTKVSDFDNCWIELRNRIISDFEIHKYTVYYWCLFDNENLEDCWTITPYIRELWRKKYYSENTNIISSSELAELITDDLLNYGLIELKNKDEVKKITKEKIDVRKSLGDYS
ncbi:hypothetical protein [Cellulophaga sp. E6(2014)]|uniref:hypothetical protein n=1 Tax=Cellulophaga sp. E6(2014) TaxID=1495334 RepID=UPI00068D6ED3|nr:hypothetical protein [Cellulophaga sp. E6(2014)]